MNKSIVIRFDDDMDDRRMARLKAQIQSVTDQLGIQSRAISWSYEGGKSVDRVEGDGFDGYAWKVTWTHKLGSLDTPLYGPDGADPDLVQELDGYCGVRFVLTGKNGDELAAGMWIPGLHDNRSPLTDLADTFGATSITTSVLLSNHSG